MADLEKLTGPLNIRIFDQKYINRQPYVEDIKNNNLRIVWGDGAISKNQDNSLEKGQLNSYGSGLDIISGPGNYYLDHYINPKDNLQFSFFREEQIKDAAETHTIDPDNRFDIPMIIGGIGIEAAFDSPDPNIQSTVKHDLTLINTDQLKFFNGSSNKDIPYLYPSVYQPLFIPNVVRFIIDTTQSPIENYTSSSEIEDKYRNFIIDLRSKYKNIYFQLIFTDDYLNAIVPMEPTLYEKTGLKEDGTQDDITCSAIIYSNTLNIILTHAKYFMTSYYWQNFVQDWDSGSSFNSTLDQSVAFKVKGLTSPVKQGNNNFSDIDYAPRPDKTIRNESIIDRIIKVFKDRYKYLPSNTTAIFQDISDYNTISPTEIQHGTFLNTNNLFGALFTVDTTTILNSGSFHTTQDAFVLDLAIIGIDDTKPEGSQIIGGSVPGILYYPSIYTGTLDYIKNTVIINLGTVTENSFEKLFSLPAFDSYNSAAAISVTGPIIQYIVDKFDAENNVSFKDTFDIDADQDKIISLIEDHFNVKANVQ